MTPPRTRARLLHTIVAMGIALTSGGTVACGGLATDYIPPTTDAGGDETDLHYPHIGIDASPDVELGPGPDADLERDADIEASAPVEVEAGQCDEGLNTTYPPAECGGPSTYWLASPYRPAHDITVELIQIHTISGSVAILSNGGSGPGALLFSGSVSTSGGPRWLGTNVTPPVSLKGGELYYLAFEGSYCSQAQGGPEATEYGAGSLEGPWTVTGTDNWTARIIGTCE